MIKGFVLGSIAALGVAGHAIAESGFDYSYVELGYVNSEIDIDGFDIDGDGFLLAGSYELTDKFHVFGGYTDQEFDFDVGVTSLEIGAGLAWPISSNLDVVSTLSFVKGEIDVPGEGKFDDDGFGVGVGLRGRALPQLELTGGVKYVDLDESGDNTSFHVGARYFFTSAFSAGVDLGYDDDATVWGLGVRMSFGK